MPNWAVILVAVAAGLFILLVLFSLFTGSPNLLRG